MIKADLTAAAREEAIPAPTLLEAAVARARYCEAPRYFWWRVVVVALAMAVVVIPLQVEQAGEPPAKPAETDRRDKPLVAAEGLRLTEGPAGRVRYPVRRGLAVRVVMVV